MNQAPPPCQTRTVQPEAESGSGQGVQIGELALGAQIGEFAQGAEGLERRFNSDDILRGAKAVVILHQGNTYRLQATKQGKLILTK